MTLNTIQNRGTFQNHFLDWLCLDEPYKNLRENLQISRDDLAKLFKISHHSIRRYESENKAPHWYYLLLRLVNGDLSFYGAQFIDVRIREDNRMSGPYFNEPLYPIEMSEHYNQSTRLHRHENIQLRSENTRLLSEIDALKTLNSELLVKVDALTNEIERLRLRDRSIKNGKVIPLFANKRN